MPRYSDNDIIKAIARIQHEAGFDFGIGPRDATLGNILAMSERLSDEFPDASSEQLLRCLRAANDQDCGLG